MNLTFFSFSTQGSTLVRRLLSALPEADYRCQAFSKEKYVVSPQLPFPVSCHDSVKTAFSDSEGIVFVGSCGLAVRLIAPYIQSKATDPAVVVLDDCASFAVSLLSGHLGGANALAETLADCCGAVPVVTTATDRRGLFAVDCFAKANQLSISDMGMAKEISAALLNGTNIGLYSEFPLSGSIPPELFSLPEYDMVLPEQTPDKMPSCDQSEYGIVISCRRFSIPPFHRTLYLTPRIVTIGIGCRKGISSFAVSEAVFSVCEQFLLSPDSICQAASIDLKQEEPGLLFFLEEHRIPFLTFSSDQLNEVIQPVTASKFVREVTGTDNVCERAALYASGGTLLIPKQVKNGVTVAAAVSEWKGEFI